MWLHSGNERNDIKMSRGNKVRIFVCIIIFAFIISIEYKTIYEVVVASPLVQSMVGDSVSQNTVAQEEGASEENTDTVIEDEAIADANDSKTEGEAIPDESDSVIEGEAIAGVNESETSESETEGNDNDGSSLISDEQNMDTSIGDEPLGTTEERIDFGTEESVSENTVEELDNAGGDYGESNIPVTEAEFKTYYDNLGKGYVTITTRQDWLNLQALSQTTSLEGYSFRIDPNSTSSDDNTSLYDLQGIGFTGIGCETYPFKGTLNGYLDTGMSIKTSVPLFAYLAGGSSISNFSVICVDSKASIAGFLTGGGSVSLTNMKVCGSIKNESGAAGGLFAEVRNTTENQLKVKIGDETSGSVTFVTQGESIKVTIAGDYSGAIAGKVYGNVSLTYDEATCNLANISTVTGTCGYENVTDPTTNASTDIYGANGFLFGMVEGDGTYSPEIILTNSKQGAATINFKFANTILGEGINGGLIGYMKNATLYTSSKTVILTGDKNTTADVQGGNINSAAANTGIGGLIGILENSMIKAGSKFEIRDMCVQASNKAKTKGIGGFFGGIINSEIQATTLTQTDEEGNETTIAETMFAMKNSAVTSTTNNDCYGFGGLAGFYFGAAETETAISGLTFDNVRVHSMDNNPNPSAGMVLGIYKGQDGNKLTISDWRIQGMLVTADKGNGVGGVVGYASCYDGASGTAILNITNGSLESAKNPNFEVTYFASQAYAIWDGTNPIGGVVGIIKDTSCEISNVELKGLSLISNSCTGGVVGEVQESTNRKHIYLSDITLGKIAQSCASYSRLGTKGLLIAKIGANTIVKLDGKMDLSAATWNLARQNVVLSPYNYNLGETYLGNASCYIGSIAGIQEKAVVYIDQDCDYTPYSVSEDGVNSKIVGYVDEIGNFGGAYRNGNWGDNTRTVFNEDKITGTVADNGNIYQIQTVADLMRLSVLLNSEGAFAAECFGNATYDTLLSGTYNLTADTYDLTNTGIRSMQRTVGKGTSARVVANSAVPGALTEMPEMFKGTFKGKDSGTKIIHNISVYRQTNQGLFGNVGSATFANLYLDENITQCESTSYTNAVWGNSVAQTGSMGGLAVYAQGNVTVENCQLDIDMTSRKYNPGTGNTDPKTYFGGLFGKYIAQDGSTLTVKTVQAKGSKTLNDNDHYASQLIACVESPNSAGTMPKIGLTNIDVSGSLENTAATDTCYLGGLIAVMNENKEDGTDEASWNATLGVENRHKGAAKRTALAIDTVTISDFQLTNSTDAYRSSGLLGFRWLDIVADVKNVTVGDKEGTAGSETVTLTTNRRFGGLLNEASGKLEFTKTNINNTTINNTNTEDYSALLVAEAEYMYLSVIDYTVEPSTVIKRSTNEYFDEIAGVSKSRHESSNGSFSLSESTGGVVSISTTGVEKSLDVSSTGTYKGYQNKATYYEGYSSGSEGSSISAEDVKNKATRYYYDIPRIIGDITGSTNIGTLTDEVINTPDELMRWSLVHYTTSELREYFITADEMSYAEANKGIDDGIRRVKYQISGTIDLNGYSYYPPNVSGRTLTGVNDATIIFHAKEILDKEKELSNGKRYPYDEDKQQYLIHGGMFNNVSRLKISGLTLSGTVTETKYHTSGALICGAISGVSAGEEDQKLGHLYSTKQDDYSTFTDICFKNLWVVREDTGTNWEFAYGLMISQITNGAKVNLDKIKMTGYDTSNPPSGENKAASALIGVVGSASSTIDKSVSEIELNFINMDIADIADNVTVPVSGTPDLAQSNDADKVLAKASFIYWYQYYEDTCQGIYTFTKADYLRGKGVTVPAQGDNDTVDIESGSGYITMGLEISSATEYIDESIDTIILQDKYGFNNTNYKPYVYNYSKREIIVNPKPGHITEGCGTYEDPYVIRTAKQLRSVYYYLRGQTAQLINWQVNAIGDDLSLCQPTYSHTITTYGKDATNEIAFPTRKQMNQAYYIIDPSATDDQGRKVLDLSSSSEFVGFGSLQEPFVGVIVGKVDNANSVPVIKLPGYVNNNKEVDSFGFIRYAKGCVVKDLNFELGTSKTDDTNYYTKVKTAGAGVIANVCGGDNIIDRVSVDGALQTVEISDNNYSETQIGGYVGCVDLGTVILRNITNTSLSNFRILDAVGESVAARSAYIWVGGIIGRVKDGAVVYEDSALSKTEPIASADSGFAYTNNSSLSASPTYGIINANYLKNAGKVSVDVNDSGFTMNADQPGKFFLVAAALNSGCLTYQGATEADLGIRNGYGADSRCRNGSYSTVGNVSSAGTPSAVNDDAYQDAIKFDNLNGAQASDGTFFAPYLLDFFTLSSNAEAMVSSALFNSYTYDDAATKSRYIDLPANQVTLNLAENVTFDMNIFGDSFRGVGAGYYKDENVFKGNVDGNGSTVQFSCLSSRYLDLEDIGLFNTVRVNKQTDGCYMKDLTISGTILNSGAISKLDRLTDDLLNGKTVDEKSGYSVAGKSGAGLIGRLEMDRSLNASGFSGTKYNYSFENVKVNEFTVESQEYAAGMIGQVVCTTGGGASSSYLNALRFTDCSLNQVKLTGIADVGGFIACYFDPLNVTFEKCKAAFVDLKATGKNLYQIETSEDGEEESVGKCAYSAAGGFVGRGVGAGKTLTILGANYQSVSLSTTGHMGGLIGETESTMKVSKSSDEENAMAITGSKITFAGQATDSELFLDNSQIETELTSAGAVNTFAASYNRTKYAGSFGGLVGFVSGPGTSIADVTITDVNGQINNGYINQTFMGGLIGRLYQTTKTGTNVYEITDCTIGSDNTDVSMIATADKSHDNRVFTGGLVGGMNCYTTTKITRCSVIGNANGTSVLQSTDTAAGMIGLARSYVSTNNLNNNIYYDNCSVKHLTINGYIRTAGVEGKREYALPNSTATVVTSRFHKVNVSDCVLYNMDEYPDSNAVSALASGGLQAYTRGVTIAVECDLKNVKMKGKTTRSAGGLVGKTDEPYGFVRAANVTISDCTIAGASAGGIVGYGAGISTYGAIYGNTCSLSAIQIKRNKIISHYYASDQNQYAGGIYGYCNEEKARINGDNITLEGNLIGVIPTDSEKVLGRTYVGGIAGALNAGSGLAHVSMTNNIVTMLDGEMIRSSFTSSIVTLPTNAKFEDYLISDSFGIWDNENVTLAKVESVSPKLYNWETKTLDEYETFTEESELLSYKQAVGLVYGSSLSRGEGNRVYDLQVSYDEAIRKYRPAVDLAVNSDTQLASGLGWAFSIIYGQYEESEYEKDSDPIGHVVQPDAYYQFGDLKKIWADFKASADKKYSYRLGTNSLLSNSTELTTDSILSSTYYDETEGYRSVYVDAQGKQIPMLVYDNNESLDVLVNTVIKVLANNDGALNVRNISKGATITARKMVIEDGVVRELNDGEDKEASVKVVASTDYSYYWNLEINSAGYDVQTSENSGTFTMLHVEYSYENTNYSFEYNDAKDSYKAEQKQSMSLDIPIYIEKVLEYQNHITGVQGAEYYLDNLLANGNSELQTLRDTYTAYVEYDYNDAYDKYNIPLTKEIRFRDPSTQATMEILDNTKFVLIDVSNQGHVYYYKASGNQTKILLSDFKDSAEKAYVEPNVATLSSLSDMSNTLYKKDMQNDTETLAGTTHAIQQFLLLVDSSEVTDMTTSYAYELVVQPDKEKSAALLKRCIEKTCPKNCRLVVTEYPGLSGKFNTNETKISGEISQESDVTINLDYTISASDAYWNYLNANSSSSIPQFLDVAVYLEQDHNRIALPTGTQITFDDGVNAPVVGVVQGNSIVYRYKDAGIVYDLNKLTVNTHITGTISLDFSSADFTGFNNGEYNVVLELLKTKDADFPMGGDVLDTHKLTVKSTAKKNLGFALEPKDLLTLGMNGYLPEESDSGVIDYDMRIDFSDYFNGSGIASSEMKALKDKYFTVEYSIEKKVKDEDGKLSYEPYNGNLVKVYFGNSQKENIGDGSKVVYKFTENYISSNDREEKYVVSFPYTVKADVDELLKTYEDITNYRVVAKLYLSDSKPTGASETKATESTEGCDIYVSPNVTIESAADGMEDFFIFTVAKIKTDLDITQ